MNVKPISEANIAEARRIANEIDVPTIDARKLGELLVVTMQTLNEVIRQLPEALNLRA